MAQSTDTPVTGFTGGPYHFNANELIVATQHLRALLSRLEPGEYGDDPSRSEALGLTRIVLRRPVATARRLRALVTDEERLRRFLPRDDVSALEQVIGLLRYLIATDNGGWVPAIGKNRLVSRVRPARVIWYDAERPQRVIWYDQDRPRAERRRKPPGDRETAPGAGVRVGVLDSGIHAHPWLAGAWTSPLAQTVRDAEPPFIAGHGTFVSGLVLSQAPGAHLEARQVLLGENATSDSWTVAQAIVELGRTGVDVLNLSFGCYTGDGQAPLALATAVDRLDPETVVVAAAGNHAEVPAAEADDPDAVAFAALPAWPAALDDVIAVGAVDRSGRRAAFSPDKQWVDAHAVGVGVRSTFLPRALPPVSPHGVRARRTRSAAAVDFGGWATWSGTSFAAPLVSGAIAARIVPGRVTPREAAERVLADARVRRRGRAYPRVVDATLW